MKTYMPWLRSWHLWGTTYLYIEVFHHVLPLSESPSDGTITNRGFTIWLERS